MVYLESQSVLLLDVSQTLPRFQEYHQCITIYQDLLSKATDEKRGRLLQLLLRISVVVGDEKLVEKFSRDLSIQNCDSQSFYLHKAIKDAFYGSNYAKAINHLQTAQKSSDGLSNPRVCLFSGYYSF